MAQIQGLDLLKSSLSAHATIVLQGDVSYAGSTARWSEKDAPKPGAVVNVTSEAAVEAADRQCFLRSGQFILITRRRFNGLLSMVSLS